MRQLSRAGARRAALLAGFVVGASACPSAPSAGPEVGCTKDVDCKGDRICEGGRCTAPPAPDAKEPAGAPVSSPASGEASAPAGPRWVRGGPGLARPSAHEGPARRPALRWEVDLGAVVFATPTILHDARYDADVAYVGTHAGRFVGVIVDGPRAGERVLDLDLGARIWARAEPSPDGLLFVGADDDTLRAIDLERGDLRWSQRLGNCDGTSKPGPEGARCDVDGGPTLGLDGYLYVGADGLYKLDPAKGEALWQWPSPSEGADLRRAHVFSSPVVDERGRVYVGDQEGFINAIDPKGETLWRYKVGSDVDGSGVLLEDGTFVVGADDGRVHAIRSDGSLRWSFVTQRDIRSSIAIGPDQRLYVSAFDGNLYALEADGAVAWVLPTGGIMHATPVVDAAGRVFVGSQDDHLYAVAPDGKVLWRLELPGDVDSSVAIASDGALVVGCDDGKLRAFAASPDSPSG